MRIGRYVIDTDSMTVEELTLIINELRNIRKRKERINHYLLTMHDLIEQAKEEGMLFTNKDFRNIVESNDFAICDTGKPSSEDGQ